MKVVSSFNNMTPTIDKGLTLLGALVSGLTIADVSTGVGIGVGVVTLCMITPRAILNWQELKDATEKRRAAREKMKRLLEEADKGSSDY